MTEPRSISPFKIIRAGEDTTNEDNVVVFSDFRPQVLPSDAPDAEVEVEVEAPKEESAPQPVSSEELILEIEQETSENPAPTPASKESGQPNPTEPGNPSSSSDPKNG